MSIRRRHRPPFDDDIGVSLYVGISHQRSARIPVRARLVDDRLPGDAVPAHSRNDRHRSGCANSKPSRRSPGRNFNFIEGPITPYVIGRHRLELHRHQHSGRAAPDRVLVGSVVGLCLRHVPEHARARMPSLTTSVSECAGTCRLDTRCAWPMKSIGTTAEMRQRAGLRPFQARNRVRLLNMLRGMERHEFSCRSFLACLFEDTPNRSRFRGTKVRYRLCCASR